MFMWVQDFYFDGVVMNEIYSKKKNVIILFIKDDCVNPISKKFIGKIQNEIKNRNDKKLQSKQVYCLKIENSNIPEKFHCDMDNIDIIMLEFYQRNEIHRLSINKDDNYNNMDNIIKRYL